METVQYILNNYGYIIGHIQTMLTDQDYYMRAEAFSHAVHCYENIIRAAITAILN